jgi:hypothetical protein
MSDKGMVTVQKPMAPLAPVTLKLSVLVLGLKLKLLSVELLTLLTLYAVQFQVPTRNVWNGPMNARCERRQCHG